MREGIRQKAMLALVGVLSLGAGSYWFFGRGSERIPVSSDPAQRKVALPREDAREGDRPPKPRVDPPSATIRRTPEPEKNVDPGRKVRRPERGKEERKKPVKAA
jgi:hypothetical protein